MKRVLCVLMVLFMLSGYAIADGAAYQAGEYEATAAGFGGDVKVTMTFDGDRIIAVEAEGPSETAGIGSRAIEQLPDAILEAQSADVDGIAGATFTSKAIRLAAQECIDQAKGVTEEVTVKMVPGTYVGQGIGFRISIPLTVSVTVSEDRIEEIVVDQVNTADTAAFIQTVIDTQLPRMLEYQSVSVDAVSGATATGNAVRQAVEAALVQAIEAAGGSAGDVRAF